jgi:hypothetical protein
MTPAAKRRLMNHIESAQWRKDRSCLRLIEAALSKLDPSLPPDTQDLALQPYVQLLDKIAQQSLNRTVHE